MHVVFRSLFCLTATPPTHTTADLRMGYTKSLSGFRSAIFFCVLLQHSFRCGVASFSPVRKERKNETREPTTPPPPFSPLQLPSIPPLPKLKRTSIRPSTARMSCSICCESTVVSRTLAASSSAAMFCCAVCRTNAFWSSTSAVFRAIWRSLSLSSSTRRRRPASTQQPMGMGEPSPQMRSTT